MELLFVFALPVLVILTHYVAVCWATMSVNYRAFKQNRFATPIYYRHRRSKRVWFFVEMLVKPWHVIPAMGKRLDCKYVIYDFTSYWPKCSIK